jgi:hypothetical protein
LLSLACQRYPSIPTMLHSLPHSIHSVIYQALDTFGPPLPTCFTGQIGPSAFSALHDSRCPDPGDDWFAGPWIVVERVFVIKASVLRVTIEDVYIVSSSFTSFYNDRESDSHGLMLGTTFIPALWKCSIIPLKSGYR